MWESVARRLEGSLVVLEPLEPRHEEGLFDAAREPGIWRYLPVDASGSRADFRSWLEAALAASDLPHLVVHGHGHAGTFEGFVGAVPVFNVAVHVMGRDFFVFELDGEGRLLTAKGDRPPKVSLRTET